MFQLINMNNSTEVDVAKTVFNEMDKNKVEAKNLELKTYFNHICRMER